MVHEPVVPELSAQVLVVNRNLQAVHITTARRAFVLMFTDVARALDPAWVAHDFESWATISPSGDVPTVGTSRGPILIPRVLQLVAYDRMPRTTIRLTRRNIFLRDGYTCQYCARRGTPRDLNLDHVMPRSRGGPMTWGERRVLLPGVQPEEGRTHPPGGQHAAAPSSRETALVAGAGARVLARTTGGVGALPRQPPPARELQTLWEQGVGTVHDVMAESA
ncbi:MAG: HNH endonuclease [Deltaproteobacteria bacterium]|nr:HNH endonuclease [Deltaproteobacteria bacterium]